MTPEFRGQQIIRLKAVMGLGPDFFCERPTYRKVWCWKKYGVGGVRLKCFREGRGVFTSLEMVRAFLKETNGELH